VSATNGRENSVLSFAVRSPLPTLNSKEPERNLEVAAQAYVDIANRIISMEQLEKPRVLERREQPLPLDTELKV